MNPIEQEIILDEVYDVWYTSFWQTPLGYVILIVLALCGCLIGYALYRLIQRHRGSNKEQALRQLKLLTEKVKKGQIDAKKAYQELTGVTKSYARWRFGLPNGLTDYELITLLAATDCTKEQLSKVKQVLEDAQSVKFGPVGIVQLQTEQDITAMSSFVEETAKSKK